MSLYFSKHVSGRKESFGLAVVVVCIRGGKFAIQSRRELRCCHALACHAVLYQLCTLHLIVVRWFSPDNLARGALGEG
jgi:hypothetical protein